MKFVSIMDSECVHSLRAVQLRPGPGSAVMIDSLRPPHADPTLERAGLQEETPN